MKEFNLGHVLANVLEMQFNHLSEFDMKINCKLHSMYKYDKSELNDMIYRYFNYLKDVIGDILNNCEKSEKKSLDLDLLGDKITLLLDIKKR